MLPTATILQGDALTKLCELPDESVQCCVTSPPYWGLRDYGTAQWEGGDEDCTHEPPQEWIDHNFNAKSAFGTGAGTQSAAAKSRWYKADGSCPACGAIRRDGQLGLEKTPEEYVAKMVQVFREVRRVLRKDGTLWLNMGDSYASASACDRRNVVGSGSPDENCKRPNRLSGVLKEKDLCGIPWRVAFALQADGWWLRSDIIWAKPNPMPESVTDRPTKSHEYLFLLTKSASYFYDAEAIREQVKPWNEGKMSAPKCGPDRVNGYDQNDRICGANKRSVWTVATAPYPEAHFATYPPDLIKPCIMAGTSAKGCCAKCGSPWERVVKLGEPIRRRDYGSIDSHVDLNNGRAGQRESKTIGWQPACKCCSWHEPKDRVYCVNHSEGFFAYKTEPCTVLDPFAGSGTTGAVALELGRKAVLIELNTKYVELIEHRCNVTPGLALN